MEPTVKYFRDDEGNYLGAWDGYWADGVFMPPVYPANGIEVPFPPDNGLQKWDFVNNTWLPLPPQPYNLAVETLWERMTEEEAETFDDAIAASSARLRRMFNAASYIYSVSELFTFVEGLLTASFGATRAAVLLEDDPMFSRPVEAAE